MAWGKLTPSWCAVKLRALLSLLVVGALLVPAACLPLPPTPPPIKVPSKVITEDGYEFYVYGLKLPGSSQELKFKEAGTTTWLPLAIVRIITFLGAEEDSFRRADIILRSGERLRGDLYIGTLIEGSTDEGYWNSPLANIRQVGMGMD